MTAVKYCPHCGHTPEQHGKHACLQRACNCALTRYELQSRHEAPQVQILEEQNLLVKHMTKSGVMVTLSASPHLEARWGEGVLMSMAVPGTQQYAEIYLDEDAIRHLFGDAAWPREDAEATCPGCGKPSGIKERTLIEGAEAWHADCYGRRLRSRRPTYEDSIAGEPDSGTYQPRFPVGDPDFIGDADTVTLPDVSNDLEYGA